MSQSGTTVSFSAPIKVEIHIVNNLFDTYKAIGAIWKVNLNRILLNTSVLIIDCSFLCNNVTSEPALRFEDIYSLLLNERNTFVNNCAKVQMYLSCLVRFSLQGNATFSNNRVNVLLYLSNYKMLNVNYTLLNISSNERVKVNDTLQQRNCCFIYMLPNMSSSEACAFQISQCVKNMTSLRTQNVFESKKGYQGVIKSILSITANEILTTINMYRPISLKSLLTLTRVIVQVEEMVSAIVNIIPITLLIALKQNLT